MRLKPQKNLVKLFYTVYQNFFRLYGGKALFAPVIT